MKYEFDLFVIGAGSGGVRAARMSAGFGAKVIIAENLYLGGTCVNAGCVPKKLFVYASHFAEDFEVAQNYGWHVDNSLFNWQSLVRNKNKEIERLNGIYKTILNSAGVKVVSGKAVIKNQHTISVGEQLFTAERILVATGSWPSIPDIPGQEYIISSNEAFHLDKLPERITIVGGGYIAVEFAGIFNGMGVDTTLMYRGPMFLRGFDEECRHFLSEEMRKKGIKIRFKENIISIVKSDSEYIAQTNKGSKLVTDLIMYATGRKPNLANMSIKKIGINVDDKGAIIVDDNYQTSIPSIYAIGDVTDRYNLTPVAITEGMTLAKKLFGNENVAVDYSNIPTCIFSQPNMGTVGLTEEQARAQYDNIDIYKSSFTPMKLSLTDSKEKTFMKMVVDKQRDRVLGVHMVGRDVGEMIQGIAIALKAGATKTQFNNTIGIHPTAAEEFVTMAGAGVNEMLLSG